MLPDIVSGLCCLTELLALASNGTLDEQVWDQTEVRQGGLSDRGGVLLLQPGSNGGPLIGVPICSYHWIHHHSLHAAMLSCYLQQCGGGGGGWGWGGGDQGS